MAERSSELTNHSLDRSRLFDRGFETAWRRFVFGIDSFSAIELRQSFERLRFSERLRSRMRSSTRVNPVLIADLIRRLI